MEPFSLLHAVWFQVFQQASRFFLVWGTKMSKQLVSVVVTTKNEEKNIGNCLESIAKQTYPQGQIEVIVVDNNSTDKTCEIARQYTNKVYNFGPERSAQRNFGIFQKSKGKYILFLDADMSLSPELLEKAVDKLESSSLIALYIPEIVLGNSFWSQVRRFERTFYSATVIDCVRIIRKDMLEKTGGFDESLTGPEDWDLDKKIRKLGPVDVLDSKDAVIYHNETGFSIKTYLAKKSYYAQSFAEYKKKWGENDTDIKKQFGFWYRYFGVFLEHGKWRKFIKHPVLALGMYFIKIALGANYLWKKK